MQRYHFRPYSPNQLVLFPQRIDKDISEDDPVRLLSGIIGSLDLSSLRKLYKERGRSPYDPKMLLAVVIYAYMNNIYSCRRIERSLKRDIHFIWLAGYEQPDFVTINRFRNRVKKEVNAVFTQVVLLLAERGFVSLDVEYIDGTKIESKANKYTFVWRKTVEKNRAKLLAKIKVLLSQIDDGKSYSTAVNQMEASWLDVKTQIVDTRRNIQSVENAICRLLAVSPQHIERSKWGQYALSQKLQNGVSASLLENRPDIRMANHVMEEAFYNTQVARAAFFPTITLSGLVGWTNNGGGAIMNPGSLLLNAVGQLTQPIFQQGKLKANLKIARLTQEDMKLDYVQTVIDAGNEVNEALADYQSTVEKHEYYHRQVSVLHEAFKGTHE